MIAVLLVAVALVVLVVRRRRNRVVLAGLDGTKPTFTVEPPHRRMGSRKTEML